MEKPMNDTPKVSVIMGIYNSEATLDRAICSIINQTFTDWEFIICDDASTDKSYQIASAYAAQDARIKVLRNDQNDGCNLVLNRCIKEAKGEYIAIMDGDDISLPMRLEKEVAILDMNPQYGIVGATSIHFNEEGDFMMFAKNENPSTDDFAFGIPHNHSTCMIRSAILHKIGGYHTHKNMKRVEDYYLMADIYKLGYRGYNIQEVLMRYCDNKESYKRRTWQNRLNEVYTYYKVYNMLRINPIYYIRLIRPILVGMLPKPIYHYLHRRPWLRFTPAEFEQMYTQEQGDMSYTSPSLQP